MSTTVAVKKVGAEAAAAPATSPWRPLILRTILGILALLGLSAIGAVSMLAGLDGAHASPPAASQIWMASSSASTGPGPTAVPSGSAPAEPGPTAATPAESEPLACPTRTEDGRIILNLAKVEDLRKIPGIGPKRAESILALRAKLKRFKRGADLLRVRGIGPKSLTRMQAHFVVDPPPGSQCVVPVAPAK